jgi:hypothetical protein
MQPAPHWLTRPQSTDCCLTRLRLIRVVPVTPVLQRRIPLIVVEWCLCTVRHRNTSLKDVPDNSAVGVHGSDAPIASFCCA